MEFINSLQSERLKIKHTPAKWICLLGSLFIPILYLAGFFKDKNSINSYGGPVNSWTTLFFNAWRFMAIAILPMSVILISSLVTQLEFKNNTWKQLHTTPQHFATIFFAKLSAIIILIFDLFLYFNAALILVAIIPSLAFDHRLPDHHFPFAFYLQANAKIFLNCLPVIAIQYLLALQFKNFLVPVGVGFLGMVASFIMVKTTGYAYLSPYSHSTLLILGTEASLPKINLQLWSSIYSGIILVVCYVLYRTKKDRG
jgi:hypothetical protein